MSKGYLCGGINGLTDDQAKNWRDDVKADPTVGESVMPWLDPMRRDYRGVEDQNIDNIVHGDYQDIADTFEGGQPGVILVNAVKPSWGTAMEAHMAYIADVLGIDLSRLRTALEQARREGVAARRYRVVSIVGTGPVSPWLRYHSHVCVPTLADAKTYLRDVVIPRGR